MLVGRVLVQLLLVSVGGVGGDRLWRLIDFRPLPLVQGRVDHRVSCEKSVERLVMFVASMICCSFIPVRGLCSCMNPAGPRVRLGR